MALTKEERGIYVAHRLRLMLESVLNGVVRPDETLSDWVDETCEQIAGLHPSARRVALKDHRTLLAEMGATNGAVK